MSVPDPCPEFEYEHVGGFEAVLKARTSTLYAAIFASGSDPLIRFLKDTRRVHGSYFRGLTPSKQPYYAGNYRGSPFPCLRDYPVVVPSDPRVGHGPGVVALSMSRLATEVDDTVRYIDFLFRVSPRALSDAEKVVRLVQLLAALLVYFFEIHPYANGNGHMGRAMITAGLKRSEFYATRWKIHPRPSPSYGELISKYRSGDRTPLERYILSTIDA